MNDVPKRIAADEIRQGWGKAYPVWSTIIEQRGLKVGAELGVGYGGNAEYMLRNTAIVKLYGVDPWPDWKFTSEELYQYVCERLAPYGDRYQHIFKRAEDATGDVPDSLDFVYVDWNHDYETVVKGLRAWIPKVRIGGILGGDGYYHGVKLAVDDLCRELGWEVFEESASVWWVEKR